MRPQLLAIFYHCICVSLVTGYSVTRSRRASPDGVTGAVAADAQTCSKIGARILNKGGSAVDSTISTMLCAGVINLHSTGVSGGGFMLIYKRESKKATVIDYKEKAPQQATRDMFKGNKQDARHGGKAIGVCGEIRGFHMAWKKYGNLPWKSVVQPVIDLARDGFKVSAALAETMAVYNQSYPLRDDPGLSELLLQKDGTFYKQGDVIKNPKYAATLESIADDPEGFYTGSLSDKIVQDIQGFGGLVTKEDLRDYQPVEREPMSGELRGMNIFTAPPPAGGVVLNYILNILRGYNMSAADRSSDQASILTYHRIVEAFKFAFAARSRLGDPDDTTFGEGIKKAAQEMAKQTTGDRARMRIWDNQTHADVTYYDVDKFFTKVDFGTSHSSVLAPNGDAVSVTSSINYWFGCGKRSTVTGIVYNDIMADFDNPGDPPIDGLYPAKVNFPGPGKRPMSSMTPSLVTTKDGDVRLVTGASGGKRIITANALLIMNKLWFGRTLQQSVTDPRVHNNLVPDDFLYLEKDLTYRLPTPIVTGLDKLGHNTTISTSFAAVQAIWVSGNGGIEAVSDPRKGGVPAYSNKTADVVGAAGLSKAQLTVVASLLVFSYAVTMLLEIYK